LSANSAGVVTGGVVSTSGFGGIGYITIGNEIIQYTGTTSTTFTTTLKRTFGCFQAYTDQAKLTQLTTGGEQPTETSSIKQSMTTRTIQA
jgi:hypothetical protein